MARPMIDKKLRVHLDCIDFHKKYFHGCGDVLEFPSLFSSEIPQWANQQLCGNRNLRACSIFKLSFGHTSAEVQMQFHLGTGFEFGLMDMI